MKTKFFIILLLVTGLNLLGQTPPNWYIKQTFSSHTIAIPILVYPTINGIKITKDDYIGVFYDSSGVYACGGYSKWSDTSNTALTAWGDDNTTGQKEGFAEGETFLWKIWQKSSNQTYISTAQFKTGSQSFTSNGTSELMGLSGTYIDTSNIVSKPNWTFTVTDVNHTIAIPQSSLITIEGLQAQNGDYIGVFYEESGKYYCAGYSKYTGVSSIAVTAYGDDASSSNIKEGFLTNEVFSWKLWRQSDKKEFFGIATYINTFSNDSLFKPNGTSGIQSIKSTNVTPNNAYFTANVSFNFKEGDIYSTTKYRMIGIPGDTTIQLEKVMTGIPFRDWAAFYDLGSSNYIPFSSSENEKFSFKPGNAFWIISKYKLQIGPVQIKSVQLSNNSYSIPLHEGWNMISNPLSTNVNWNWIKTVNGIANDQAFYFINGRYDKSSVLIQPYLGYYFYNRNNLSSLLIPVTAPALAPKTNIISPDSIRIDLIANNEIQSSGYILIDDSFLDALDDFDIFTPPNHYSEYDLSFEIDKAKTYYKKTFTDSRPSIYDGITFNLNIKSIKSEHYSLLIDGIEKYPDFEFWVKKSNSEFLKLENLKELKLVSDFEMESLRLIAKKTGTFNAQDYIGITDYNLLQNYPNPFNPTTSIRYQIPNSGRVNLKLFDILGNEIAVLVDKEQTPGEYNHQLNSDELGLTSGVYFYQLKSGSYTKTMKMILVK